MRLGSLESTLEARAAVACGWSNSSLFPALQASQMHPKLDRRTLSIIRARAFLTQWQHVKWLIALAFAAKINLTLK